MKLLISGLFDQDSPLDVLFDRKMKLSTPNLMENLAQGFDKVALVIWGGEDISPSIYGQKASRKTQAEDEPSTRDKFELALMKKAIALDIPIIGICRGAQLACAVAGGTLVQHVDNHGMSHMMITSDDHELVTNSVHHQMMNPFKIEHELLAWSSPLRIATQYFGEDNKLISPEEMPFEPEVVWFPKIKALGIQGHPEFGSAKPPFIRYCHEVIKRYITETRSV